MTIAQRYPSKRAMMRKNQPRWLGIPLISRTNGASSFSSEAVPNRGSGARDVLEVCYFGIRLVAVVLIALQ